MKMPQPYTQNLIGGCRYRITDGKWIYFRCHLEAVARKKLQQMASSLYIEEKTDDGWKRIYVCSLP